jgi:asparagine synthetase B (glutamine-hydrolysing)
MCGIRISWGCACSRSIAESDLESISIKHRGPDAYGTITARSGDTVAVISAAVLHLRGIRLLPQPASMAVGGGGDAHGEAYLCWNGEVFGGLRVPESESDTSVIASAARAALASDTPHTSLASSLSAVTGPFAFAMCYGDSLYFGRDPVGRRSLLLELPTECGQFAVVASVASLSRKPHTTELVPTGVYRLSMAADMRPSTEKAQQLWTMPSCTAGRSWILTRVLWPLASPFRAGLTSMLHVPGTGVEDSYEWAPAGMMAAAALELLRRLGEAVRVRVSALPPSAASETRCACGKLPHRDGPIVDVSSGAQPCMSSSATAPQLLRVPSSDLSASVSSVLARALGVGLDAVVSESRHLALPASNELCDRCGSVPGGSGARVAVPFSGGLDSMVLARLTHEYVPAAEPIDLINVCFARGHRSPDRLAALAGLHELRLCCPGRKWQLICVDEDYEAVLAAAPAITSLLHPCLTHMDFNIGAALWCVGRGIGFLEAQTGGSSDLPEPSPDSGLRYAGPGAGAKVRQSYGIGEPVAGLTQSSPSALDVDDARFVSSEDCARALHGWWKGDASAADISTPARDSLSRILPTDFELVTSCVADGISRYSEVVRATLSVASSMCSAAPAATASVVAAFESALGAESAGSDDENGDSTEAAVDSAPAVPAAANISSSSCDRGGLRKSCPGLETRKCASPAHRNCSSGMCRNCCLARGPASLACLVHFRPTPQLARAASPVAGPPPKAASEPTFSEGPTAAAMSTRLTRLLVRSSARVLISGLGADEAMGGYGRHRTAFRHGGWHGLQHEMAVDCGRIWKRNLGRDDRVYR